MEMPHIPFAKRKVCRFKQYIGAGLMPRRGRNRLAAGILAQRSQIRGMEVRRVQTTAATGPVRSVLLAGEGLPTSHAVTHSSAIDNMMAQARYEEAVERIRRAKDASLTPTYL